MTGQSVSLALSFVCWAWLAAVALLMVVDSEIVTKHHLDQHAPRMLACALILLVLALVP